MRSIKDHGRISGETFENNENQKAQTAALMEKYAGKSESELMHALLKSVTAAKSDGSFSSEQLDEFVGFVSPSLDESSRERLISLVRMIKDA
ncbi:MAG: hypothetical protein J1G01_05535 [Clostridiales bacterium]|nr:hypothetical protein [Clostridiales bacterium]